MHSLASIAGPDPGSGPSVATRYRTLWISDLHLGTKACQAERLCRFLEAHRADRLYLVGDVIDGWQLRRGWHWTSAQTRVVELILAAARRGTRVLYLPGNHDAGLREYDHMLPPEVEIADETIHVTADGRRLWVLHGDQFDAVVRGHLWLSHLGDRAYEASLILNRWLNRARALLGLPYWSLSAYLKRRVKKAVRLVGRFESALAHEAARRGVDGVVCGHIHKADLREIDGILYANDGDWVESCTALAEHADGTLEVLYEDPLAADLADTDGARVSRANRSKVAMATGA